MGLLPTYNHIINPKLKNIYLSFNANGELVIKSPKVPIERIEKLIISKSSWIEKARQRIMQKKGQINFQENKSIYYLGDPYMFEHNINDSKTVLVFDGESFVLHYRVYDEAVFGRKIDRFYLERAKEFVPPLVDLWANKMQLNPTAIKFRKTKSQWGSCNSKNVLSFNTMMMKLPQNIIEYIIVHELCHIVHKHHKKSFWEMVGRFMPNYKQARMELKSYI
ncbi:MAG: SprT family zinc-dependent metalloprotease [Sulfurovaceae bacterium]|mgnify:CR=1 FL=1|nr:SprT family zinc-dependent metalloprotease [Sulfurovaceae bacterium]